MPFAAGLRQCLQVRQSQVPLEIAKGEDLEQVLGRYLLAIEEMADRELITSILLLSKDGTRLSHGAAPSLPQSYCDAIDGSAIGPTAGSCGTAAYLGQPIYVSDIAADPLWKDYRHLALPHGLRSCWSTPIPEPGGKIIGTFAIYSPSLGTPDDGEIESIGLITEHVAEAIMLARSVQDLSKALRRTPLRLVVDHSPEIGEVGTDRLLALSEKLEAKATELDRLANSAGSRETAETLRATAELSRKLVHTLRREIDGTNGTPAR